MRRPPSEERGSSRECDEAERRRASASLVRDRLARTGQPAKTGRRLTAWRRDDRTDAIREGRAAFSARRTRSRAASSSMSCRCWFTYNVASAFTADRSFLRPRYFRCATGASPRTHPATTDVRCRIDIVIRPCAGQPSSAGSSYTATPSTNVPTARVSPIRPAPRSNRSRSSTARSASLPTSIEPVSSSRWFT
jgi:hypothetical protein